MGLAWKRLRGSSDLMVRLALLLGWHKPRKQLDQCCFATRFQEISFALGSVFSLQFTDNFKHTHSLVSFVKNFFIVWLWPLLTI